MTIATDSTLTPVFNRLREIMARFEPELKVLKDEPGNYSLESSMLDEKGRPVWFGGVQTKKQYVSYHLMPVYLYPELASGVSEGLRKQMQGKSCFNFKREDKVLFSELEILTERGLTRLMGRS